MSLSLSRALPTPNCFHTPTCPRSHSHARRSSVAPVAPHTPGPQQPHRGCWTVPRPDARNKRSRGGPLGCRPCRSAARPLSSRPKAQEGIRQELQAQGLLGTAVSLVSVWGNLVKDTHAGRCWRGRLCVPCWHPQHKQRWYSARPPGSAREADAWPGGHATGWGVQ